jgi:hypothetical protein
MVPPHPQQASNSIEEVKHGTSDYKHRYNAIEAKEATDM